MKDLKKVKIYGTLCIIFALLGMLISIISSTFGYSVFMFNPTDESSFIGFQYFLNFLINISFNTISILTMYLALAGFYFYGAIDKDRCAKVLFGVLVVLAFLEIGISTIYQTARFLHLIEVINLNGEALKDFYGFWNQQTFQFYRLTPFISIIFGIKALAAKKVSVSMRLVPIFAAFLYLLPTYFGLYNLANPEILPNLLALLVFFGLLALYFSDALGKDVWAKILFGTLLLIMSVTILVKIISFISNLFLQTGLGGEFFITIIGFLQPIQTGTSYLLIPLSVIFGITVLVRKNVHFMLGIIVICAGIYYLINSLILSYFGSDIPWWRLAEAFSIIRNDGLINIIWCLVAVAILGVNRLAKPFLLLVILLNFLHMIMLWFVLRNDTQTLISMFVYSSMFSLIIQIIFMYYIWSAIDDGGNKKSELVSLSLHDDSENSSGGTKIKPWLAITVGLIPIVNSIWFLVLMYKYSTAFNEFVDRNKSSADYISRTPFIVYIVLTVLLFSGVWIPYITIIIGLPYLIVYICLITYICNKVLILDNLNLIGQENT